MEYSEAQLKLIQKKLQRGAKNLKDAKGFGAVIDAASYLTWVSHANLAGYDVDKETGNMYKESGKITREYFNAGN